MPARARCFYTERRARELERIKAAEATQRAHGTVGAVALDQQGRLAAGTSTGGTANKRWGRIGDSPIIGAGTYANDACAVSGTGVGEFFMRNVVGHDICARMRYKGESLEQAAHEVVMDELVAQHGDGGVIALDKDGSGASGRSRSSAHAVPSSSACERACGKFPR